MIAHYYIIIIWHASVTLYRLHYYLFVDFKVILADEEFESDGVTVTVEWISIESSLYINITPHLPFNFSESTRVQLKVPYNTAVVRVVVTPSDPCGQNSVFELYYGNLNHTCIICGMLHVI